MQKQIDFDLAIACKDCDADASDLDEAARDGWQQIEPAEPPCTSWFTHLGICPECWPESEYNPDN